MQRVAEERASAPPALAGSPREPTSALKPAVERAVTVVLWLVSFATGEYLVSGKLLAYCIAVALFTLLYVSLRRIGCRAALSAALVASVLAAPTGLLAAEGIRGDALPVVLQLAALVLVARGVSRRRLVAAGVLT